MGRVLQIRVSASTYRDEDVVDAWPRLVALAWPNGVTGPEGGGVLALVSTLDGAWNFAGWKDDIRSKLGSGIQQAAELSSRLQDALAEWNPREANTLSNQLEAALDDLERVAPKP